MKKVFLFILLITLCPVFAIDNEIKLYDNADILSKGEEDTINKKIFSFINQYNIDCVVVTTSINTLGDTDRYLKKFYVDNHFGFTSKKSGIILVVDLDNNDYKYKAYGDAQRYFTRKIKKDIDSYITHIYNENHHDSYALITSFMDKMDSTFKSGIPKENEKTYVTSDGIMKRKTVYPFFKCLIISTILSFIITLFIYRKVKEGN